MRRERLPTPVFLPGGSHAQRSLAGYSPWDHKELDTTEQLSTLPLFLKKRVRAISRKIHRTFLVAQWLRSNAGDLGSIPGQETVSFMPQLKIPHTAMQTEDPGCRN